MDFQTTLFQAPSTASMGFEEVQRRELTDGAGVDIARTWLPDPDEVFETLVADVPWRAERRQMYDRVVDYGSSTPNIIDEP